MSKGGPFRDGVINPSDFKSFQFPNNIRRIKIDVGLSVNAPQSQVWLENDPQLFVVGFEPLLSNIQSILLRNSNWPISLDPNYLGNRMAIVACALSSGNTPRLENFYVTDADPGCSSLFKPRNFSVRKECEVSVYKLDDFYDMFPWEIVSKIQHLKIDTQGSDYQVLLGAKKILNRTSAVTVEIDEKEYLNSPNSSSKIHHYLTRLGFSYVRKSKIAEIRRTLRGIRIKLNTDDPTYIRESDFVTQDDSIPFIYQKG